MYSKPCLSPRPVPKISLRDDHNWRNDEQLGFTVEQRRVGKLVQQSLGDPPRAESSKPTQTNPNPSCDRTGQPVSVEHNFVERDNTSFSQEISDKRLHHEFVSSESSGKPERMSEDIRVELCHDRSGKPVGTHTHFLWKNKEFLKNIVTLKYLTRMKNSKMRTKRRTSTTTSLAC